MSRGYAAEATEPVAGPTVGAAPWALARRRLLRNRVAMTMLVLLSVILALSLAAPLYANRIAHTDPFQSNLDGTTIVDGKRVPVMQQETSGLGLGVTPVGPTWDPRHFMLGADNQGRDVAARLLYGGRNSLLIGFAAALLTCLLGTVGRGRRGILRWCRRRCPQPLAGRRLGVSGLPARDLPLGCPDHARPVDRADRARVRQPLAPDLHHRHRLRPLRGATDPR